MSKPLRYPHDTYWAVQRGDEEIDVLVEYGVEERGTPATGLFGPPEDYDPGSGWLFYINPDAMAEEGVVIQLTDQEVDAIHSWLEENHEDDDADYDY